MVLRSQSRSFTCKIKFCQQNNKEESKKTYLRSRRIVSRAPAFPLDDFGVRWQQSLSVSCILQITTCICNIILINIKEIIKKRLTQGPNNASRIVGPIFVIPGLPTLSLSPISYIQPIFTIKNSLVSNSTKEEKRKLTWAQMTSGTSFGPVFVHTAFPLLL